MDASTILSSPAGLATITVAILAVVHYQRGLSYREVVVAQAVLARVFRAVDPVARRRGRPLTREKPHPGESLEFVASYPVAPREIVREIRPPFAPQLLATAKYRPVDGRRQYTHSQWVRYHDDGMQTHVYLFTDGSETDVYAHVEAAVTDPDAHHGGEGMRYGDARGAFADALRGE